MLATPAFVVEGARVWVGVGPRRWAGGVGGGLAVWAVGWRRAAQQAVPKCATFRAGITWEHWLELWQEIPLDHLPGYPYWEPQVFRSLTEHFGVLMRVYSYYAKLGWLRSFSLADVDADGIKNEHTLTIGVSEWAQFVLDCRLTSSKYDEEHVSRKLPQGTAGAYLPEFFSSLLSLAFWRGNSFVDDSNPENLKMARRDRRLRPLPYCLGQVLKEHVVPLAHRDSSQRFRAR